MVTKMESTGLLPFPQCKRINQTQPYDNSSGSSSEEEEEEEEEETSESSEDENTDDSSSALTVAAPALDGSSGAASRKLWGEAGKGIGRKRKRVEVDVVVDDEEGENRVDEWMVWEDAMVKLMGKKFDYQEEYVRLKIASMSKSTRDLLVKRWFHLKAKLDKAIVNLRCVENEGLQALFRS